MKKLLAKHPKIYYVLVFISCCLMQASTVGLLLNCMGLFIVPISNALNVSRGQTTFFVTLISLVGGLSSPLVNKTITKIKLNKVAITSSSIVLISMTFIAYSKSIYLIYLFAIILGISLVFYSSLVSNIVLNNWFEKNNATLTGISMAFSGISGAFFNPIVSNNISLYGYQKALIISGTINLILALIPIMVVTLKPSEVGLERVKDENKKAIDISSSDSYEDPIILILIAIYGFLASSLAGLNPSISAFGQSLGYTSIEGAMMVSIAMISNLISKFLFGFLADHMHPTIVARIFTTIMLIGMFLIQIANSFKMVYLSFFLYGFTFATNTVGYSTIIKDAVGIRNYARYYSLFSIITSVFYAISITLIGISYDLTKGYIFASRVLIVIGILNIIVSTLIHIRKKKNS